MGFNFNNYFLSLVLSMALTRLTNFIFYVSSYSLLIIFFRHSMAAFSSIYCDYFELIAYIWLELNKFVDKLYGLKQWYERIYEEWHNYHCFTDINQLKEMNGGINNKYGLSYLFEEFLTKVIGKAILLFCDHHPIVLLRWSVMPQCWMEGYTGSNLCLFQILIYSLHYLV